VKCVFVITYKNANISPTLCAVNIKLSTWR